MELKMKDVMELLQAPEKEVLKLIKTEKLPAHKISHQYMFNKQEIKEWIIRNGITVNEKFLELKLADMPVSVAGLIKKGGIIYGVKGNSAQEILADAVSKMKTPPELKKEAIFSSLIEREEMMPTAVGRGIAIPHPRNPIIADVENENITVCSLAAPVAYGAMDGMPVHTMFIVLSANPRRHLEILSKLLFLCQKPEFTEMLKAGSPFKEVLSYIEAAEARLSEKGK
jgi:PTS system nitrogen regulatory IIA component